MRYSKLRRLLREGGYVGVILVGLFVLLKTLLAHRRSASLFVTAAVLIAWISYQVFVGFMPRSGTAQLQTYSSWRSREMSATREYGQFSLHYQAPTSQEGNSVAVIGAWQDQGENLPHSSALWTLDPFTGQVHRLFYGPLHTYRVDWQVGGKRLAFTGNSFTYADGKNALPLWIADVASGHKIEVAPANEKWYVSNLQWSADGKWLAYNRAPRPNQQGSDPELGTWVVSDDGKRQFRVPVPTGIERLELIGWRPGSPEVYVSEGYPFANRNLWLCDLNGNARKLEIPATYPSLLNAPRHGKHICVRTLEREGPHYAHHVRTFTAEGTPALDLGLIDTSGDAKWSDNGQWLAFADRKPVAGNVTLHLLRGDASRRKEVIAGYGREYQPTIILWSPTGGQILVSSEKAFLIDTRQGKSKEFRSSFRPCSWRADNRLIGLSSNSVGVLSPNGKVEKVYPPESFTGVE